MKPGEEKPAIITEPLHDPFPQPEPLPDREPEKLPVPEREPESVHG